MKITVTGATETAKHLDDYRKKLPKMVKKLAGELKNVGVQQFRYNYKMCHYAGTNDITVSWNETEKGFDIKASGTSVLFIEFGTGIYYPDDNPYASELGMVRGGYGKGNGNNEYWGYYGEAGDRGWHPNGAKNPDLVITRGNEGANATYKAVEKMRKDLEKIAKEVFGNA